MSAPFKTVCRAGHPMIEGNLYHRPDGKRECLTCKLARNQQYYKIHRIQKSIPK